MRQHNLLPTRPGGKRGRPGNHRPSFLFVGPPRAGSSWFAEILREHPDVFVPPNKGTFFFSRHYGLGAAWYERFFDNIGQQVGGEICEDYLQNPQVFARIREYAPDMRLICCLRNPYERAISAWRFFARNGAGEDSLLAQSRRFPAVIAGGDYASHLRVAHEHFARAQILTFFFEDIASDPHAVARRLYGFIGVDPDFVPKSLRRRINGNGQPRSALLARLVHDMHEHSWGTSRVLSNAIGRIKRVRPLRRLVQAALYSEHEQTQGWKELLFEFPSEVINRYEREITELERMLGQSLGSWHIRRCDTREGATPWDGAPPADYR